MEWSADRDADPPRGGRDLFYASCLFGLGLGAVTYVLMFLR